MALRASLASKKLLAHSLYNHLQAACSYCIQQDKKSFFLLRDQQYSMSTILRTSVDLSNAERTARRRRATQRLVATPLINTHHTHIHTYTHTMRVRIIFFRRPRRQKHTATEHTSHSLDSRTHSRGQLSTRRGYMTVSYN